MRQGITITALVFLLVGGTSLAIALWLSLWFHGDERVSQPPSAPSGLTVRTE